MRRHLILAAAAVSASILGAAALAQEPQGYLPAGAVDAVALLGPPPAADSPAQAADTTAYMAALAGAGSPRWAQALADDDIAAAAVLKRYACALDADLDPAKAPATTRLLARTLQDAGTISEAAKQTYRRPRPFAADDPTTPLCLDIAAERRGRTSFSYPSGHATVGFLWGLVLSEVAPERTTPVMIRTRSFVDSRQVCRVHYPSDLRAGELLGAAIYARLQASPEYEADVRAARAELAAAPKPTGCAN